MPSVVSRPTSTNRVRMSTAMPIAVCACAGKRCTSDGGVNDIAEISPRPTARSRSLPSTVLMVLRLG